MNAVTQRKYKLMDEPLTLRTYSGYSINSPQGFCKVNFWNDVKQLDGYDLDECLWKCIVLAGDGSKTLPCKCNAPSGKAWKVISIKSLHIDLCSNRQWRVTFVAVDIPVELAERGCKAEIERLTKLVDQKDSEIHKLMEDCVCHERSLRISKNALAAAIGRGDRLERQIKFLPTDYTRVCNHVSIGWNHTAQHIADILEDENRRLEGVIHKLEENYPDYLIKTVKTLKAGNAVLRNDLEQKGDLNVASLRDAVREWRTEARRLQGENKHLTESVQVLKERKEKIRENRNQWRFDIYTFMCDIEHILKNWSHFGVTGEDVLIRDLNIFRDRFSALDKKWSEDNSNE